MGESDEINIPDLTAKAIAKRRELEGKSVEEIREIFRKPERRREAQREEIMKRSVSPYDLPRKSYAFDVEDVLIESFSHVVREGERRFGGRNRVSDAGHSSVAKIKVYPLKGNPIRNLDFIGNTGVRAGDRVLAEIVLYTMHHEQYDLDSSPRERTFYLPAGEEILGPKGRPISLTITDSRGSPLRTERAVNYSHFVDSKKSKD